MWLGLTQQSHAKFRNFPIEMTKWMYHIPLRGYMPRLSAFWLSEAEQYVSDIWHVARLKVLKLGECNTAAYSMIGGSDGK